MSSQPLGLYAVFYDGETRPVAGFVLEQDAESYAKEYSSETSRYEIKRVHVASEWQPIETAPVNESVLIYIPNAEHYGEGIYRALLVESDWMTLEDGSHPRHWQTTGLHIGRDCLSQLPTHWMPLPDPPNSKCCELMRADIDARRDAQGQY